MVGAAVKIVALRL
jgi:hypothetical protein